MARFAVDHVYDSEQELWVEKINNVYKVGNWKKLIFYNFD